MAIPKKFYVSRNYRGTEEVLGFMVVADAEHTKAFQKKKETADRWARGSQVEPIYVDNVPRTGFQIVTNVSRYSTSNVVWRCYHPEGFEFEITSDNFMDLIQTSTIIEGAIQEELFFTDNKKLVSTKTKLFAKEIALEEKKAEQATLLSTIEEGDIFEFAEENYREMYKDKYQYCGKYHVLVMNKTKPLCVPEKSSKKEVIQNLTTGKYHIRSKISHISIRKCGSGKIDRSQVVEALNVTLRDPFTSTGGRAYDPLNDHYHLFVAGDAKPFKKSDCTVEYKDIDPRTIRCYTDEYFMYYEYRGKTMRILGAYSDDTGYYRNEKAQKETWAAASGTFAFDAELLENGQLDMVGVDLEAHKGFSGWRNETPFYGFGRYHSDAPHKLHFDKMPETIKFGTIKIGK